MKIERRYEYYSRDGKVWSPWFVYRRLPAGADGEAVLAECRRIPECYRKLRGEYRLSD